MFCWESSVFKLWGWYYQEIGNAVLLKTLWLKNDSSLPGKCGNKYLVTLRKSYSLFKVEHGPVSVTTFKNPVRAQCLLAFW